MQQISFSLIETLHLLALFPCIFAVVLLIAFNGLSARIVVPTLFFAALSGSFLIGLQDVIYPDLPSVRMLFVWVESIQPAVCFLLIIHLWRDRIPSPIYWLILTLPIVGGTSLVIATLQIEEVCLLDRHCLEAFEFRMLYQFFATALIFLLLTVHLARIPIANSQQPRYQSHRYWLMIALIVSYTVLMLVDLFTLTEHISTYKHDLIHVIMRLCFIYLVTTSLFRVFDKESSAAAATARTVDPEVIEAITKALEEDKLYRQMNFSREQCAKALELPEHVLSRAINQTFEQNFNEFVNSYRVKEAKHRLSTESTSITAIAFEVGFSSIASFNRVFKAMVGQSPTAYRSANGEGASESD